MLILRLSGWYCTDDYSTSVRCKLASPQMGGDKEKKTVAYCEMASLCFPWENSDTCVVDRYWKLSDIIDNSAV